MDQLTVIKRAGSMLFILIIAFCLCGCSLAFLSPAEEPEPYTGPEYTAFDPHFPFEHEEEMMNRLIELRNTSKDAAGWIRIQDTGIDFPVVQGDDNAYYLKHDHLGQYTRYGAIFMDYRNNPQSGVEKNTILYGHNMKNDRMFGSLMPFKDAEFALNHPYIELVTDKGYSVWKLFSAHVTSRDFYYIDVNFNTDQSFMEFLNALQDRSLHDFGVELTAQDRILTLSTCSYEFKDAFFAMHAVLVYEYDFAEMGADDSVPGGDALDS